MDAQNENDLPFISGFVDGLASIKEIEENTDVQYHRIDSEKDTAKLEEIIEQLESVGKDFNNEVTLRNAANAIAAYFLRNIRHNTEDIAEMIKPSVNSTYVSLGQLFVEVASLYLIHLDKLSLRLFGKDKSDLFYDRFLDDFVALAALTNYRARAHDMQSVLVSELNSKIKQYSKFPLIGSDAYQPDTQVYQFGINIAKIIGLQGKQHLLKSTASIYAVQVYMIKEFMALDQILERIFIKTNPTVPPENERSRGR